MLKLFLHFFAKKPAKKGGITKMRTSAKVVTQQKSQPNEEKLLAQFLCEQYGLKEITI